MISVLPNCRNAIHPNSHVGKDVRTHGIYTAERFIKIHGILLIEYDKYLKIRWLSIYI